MSESIRIITEPTIHLIGRQTIDQAELDAFLKEEEVEGWQTDTEVAGHKLIEVAGRLCYKSYAKPRPGGNAAYLDHIIEVGHGSVIEHAVFNFIITGVSRSFTHELIRHRVGMSYSQRSQRYCDEAQLNVVVPPALIKEVEAARAYIKLNHIQAGRASHVSSDIRNRTRPDPATEAGLIWLGSVETSQTAYTGLAYYLSGRLSTEGFDNTDVRKKALEAARSVLPNATETQIFVTANARALRHFIELRGSYDADAEIRAVAIKLLLILQAEAPNLFGDYRFDRTDSDVTFIQSLHPKV